MGGQAELVWRPMLLGGVFRAIGAPDRPGDVMNRPKAVMNLLDMYRWADHFGVPFQMPAGHPRRSVEAMRLVVAHEGAARVALSKALFDAYWVRGQDITKPEVLAICLERAGLDRAGLDRAGLDDVKQRLREATDEAIGRGVFGAPAFWVEPQGLLFWGQDRLDFVAKALRGWTPRAP